jgi:hypothetical protein
MRSRQVLFRVRELSNKILVKKIAIILAAILLFTFWQTTKSYSQVKSSETNIALLTKEQWLEDLKFLARELPRRHKNALHTVPKEQFERVVAELDGVVPIGSRFRLKCPS